MSLIVGCVFLAVSSNGIDPGLVPVPGSGDGDAEPHALSWRLLTARSGCGGALRILTGSRHDQIYCPDRPRSSCGACPGHLSNVARCESIEPDEPSRGARMLSTGFGAQREDAYTETERAVF